MLETECPCMYLKHFEILVLQFKKPKSFRLTKENSTLTFSQNLTFTIHSLSTESKEKGQMVPKAVAINHHQTI